MGEIHAVPRVQAQAERSCHIIATSLAVKEEEAAASGLTFRLISRGGPEYEVSPGKGHIERSP